MMETSSWLNTKLSFTRLYERLENCQFRACVSDEQASGWWNKPKATGSELKLSCLLDWTSLQGKGYMLGVDRRNYFPTASKIPIWIDIHSCPCFLQLQTQFPLQATAMIYESDVWLLWVGFHNYGICRSISEMYCGHWEIKNFQKWECSSKCPLNILWLHHFMDVFTSQSGENFELVAVVL